MTTAIPSHLLSLPLEKLEEIVQSCGFRELGRLAQTCRLLRNITADNAFWRGCYERQWGPQANLGPDYPHKWKHLYRHAHAAEPLLSLNPQTDNHPSGNRYWSFGLPNLALWLTTNPVHDLKWKQVYAATLGIFKPATSPIAYPLYQSLAQIIALFHQDREAAFAAFKANLSQFMNHEPILGLWLKNLFHCQQLRHLFHEHFPIPNKTIKKNKPLERFLRGAAILWLDRGKLTEALITAETVHMYWEKLSPLPKSEDLETSDFRPFWKAMFTGVCIDSRVEGLEKIGDLLQKSPTLQYIYMARDAYVRALQSTHFTTPEAQLRIAFKLSELCILLGSYLPLQVNLVMQTLQSYLQSSTYPLELPYLVSFCELTHLAEAKEYYPLLLREVQQKRYHPLLNAEAASLFVHAFELCKKAGHPCDAVHYWVMLCDCLSHDLEDENLYEYRETVYHRIYALLDDSDAARDKLLSIRKPRVMIQIAIAYAHHCKGDDQTALGGMIGLMQYVDEEDVHWMRELGNRSLKAAVIYSLLLHSDAALKNYYINELPDNQGSEKWIYYNLAARLYMEGYFQEALECCSVIFEVPSEDAEHYALHAACLNATGDRCGAALALKKALELDPLLKSPQNDQHSLDWLIICE